MEYLKHNLKAFWLFTGLKFKRVITFRTNLYVQITGMFINNMGLFAAWWLLLARTGSINGYGIQEMMLIQGFVAVFYAYFFWLLGGVNKLGEYLNQDRFLDLQLYPVSPLTVLLTKAGSPSHFGDFLQGMVFLAIYAVYNPSSIPYTLFGPILVTFGLLGVMLFFNSLLFFNQKVVDAFTNLVDNVYIGASMYPSKNFAGIFRAILYGILLIPIVSVPIEVARGFLNPSALAWTCLAVLIANVLGYSVWRIGVKKVESGSGGGVVE